MIVKLLTEHHLEFLSLKGGCRGSSESTHVKMSNCSKSHALALYAQTLEWPFTYKPWNGPLPANPGMALYPQTLEWFFTYKPWDGPLPTNLGWPSTYKITYKPWDGPLPTNSGMALYLQNYLQTLGWPFTNKIGNCHLPTKPLPTNPGIVLYLQILKWPLSTNPGMALYLQKYIQTLGWPFTNIIGNGPLPTKP